MNKDSKHPNGVINSMQNRFFLGIFLPTVVLVTVLLFAAYRLEYNSSRETIQLDEENLTDLVAETATDFFSYATKDLLFLAAMKEIEDYFSSKDEETLNDLAGEFTVLCEVKTFCDKVRIINNAGKEILNLKRSGGDVLRVPNDEHQDKSKRYYVKEMLKLDKGEVYVSPMDLNMEHGKIEIPWKPVVRIGTPVYDKDGEKQGVVILSLRGSMIIERIKSLSHGRGLRQMILSPEGYWLYGGEAGDAFAFMFEEKKDRNFAAVYPKIWSRLRESGAGQFLSAEASTGSYAPKDSVGSQKNLYTFITLYRSGSNFTHREFGGDLSKGSAVKDLSGAEPYWKIVSYLPEEAIGGTILSKYLLIYILLIGIITVFSDIFSKDKINKKEAEDRYRMLHKHAFDGILITDKNGTIVEYNKSIEKSFGYSESELLGKNLSMLIPDKYIHAADTSVSGRMIQVEGLRKSGQIFPIELILTSFKASGSYYITATIRDISERMRIEYDLLLEKERLSQTLRSIGDGVITTDVEGRVAIMNMAAEELTGWSQSEAAGKRFLEVFQIINTNTRELCEDPLEKIFEFKDAPCGLKKDTVLISRDGSERFLSASIAPVNDKGKNFLGAIIVFRDLTRRMAAEREKTTLEQQLLHAQKLEAIGTLAAGIAHEINTPIQFIGDNTRFLQDSIGELMMVIEKYRKLRDAVDVNEKTEKLLKDVEEAEEEAEIEYLAEDLPQAVTEVIEGVGRVSTIVKAMKNFSHPDSEDMALSDINKAISNTLIISRNEYKYVAEVKTEFDEDLPPIPCFLNELNQVFLNLIVNAAHAIEEAKRESRSKEPGLISIKTRMEEGSAVIELTDTGTGIPEKAQTHIFEPFYTTKEVGKGTGQGLAIAHSVITKKHHGTITFITGAGRGTTFIITLPIVQDEQRRSA